MSAKAYSQGLEKNAANHVPLTPLTFLDRTADVYPNRTAIVHGSLRQTWAATRERCYRLASALVKLGIEPGDTVSCAWHDEWDALPAEQQGRLKARQGVRAAALEHLKVADSVTLEPVSRDAAMTGEVLVRGNTVMMGYLKNPESTAKAFAGGWFHTGDVATVHPDGYMQITDRAKDIIISGGENISSVEVEEIIYRMPGVLYAAVVAQPDEKWGETPCAFVELKPGVTNVTEADVIAFCRERLAHFKCPRRVIFVELPKTATGKIQKFRLREQAGSRGAIARLAG